MIDVIVPIHNRPDYTTFFLRALSSTDPGTPIRPVIVDNGSDSEIRGVLSRWASLSSPFLGQTLILNSPSNRGFAGGVNLALRSRPLSPFVIIMHNDTRPFPGWAAELKACITGAPDKVAAVMPRTSYANETSMCHLDIRFEFEAIKPPNKDRMTSRKIQALMDRLYVGGHKEILEEARADLPRTFYCPEVASFCMITSRKLLGKGFDEDFFPRGYEDKLWFAKLERQGFWCEVANWAYVHHFGNITSDGPGFTFPAVYEKNEKLFSEKLRNFEGVLDRRKLRSAYNDGCRTREAPNP